MSQDLERREESAYPLLRQDSDEFFGEVRELLQGAQIDSFDLPQARITSGGANVWQLAPEGDAVKELVGVLVGERQGRAYFSQGIDESSGQPPDCVSHDMETGVGDPGGPCSECPLNEFGSDRSERGKACKEHVTLLIVRQGQALPTAVKLPPTSLRPWKRAKVAMLSRLESPKNFELHLELEKRQAQGGQSYSQVHPRIGRKLSEEEREAFGGFRQVFQQDTGGQV